MIYTVTLNPAVDKTVEIDNFTVDTVNRVSSVRLDAGGKGINVSKVISSLGGCSTAMGILGGSAGRYVKAYLDERSIDNDFVFINAETRTNLKVIDGLRKTNTDINEPGPHVGEYELELLKDRLLEHVGRGYHTGYGDTVNNSIVIFSGSVPASVSKDVYCDWIKEVKALGARTILDADGELLKQGIEAGPYIVKPNIHELEKLFDTAVESVAQADTYSRRLVRDYGIEMAVVSLGGNGALFVDKSRSLLVHGLKVDVKSTVGAGDSMVAALAYSIDKGFSFESSAKLAAASATANVTTSGTQPADLSVIKELEKLVSFEYLSMA